MADPRKMRQKLNWEPNIKFSELIRVMVDADMEEVGMTPIGEGHRILQAKFGNWHHWSNSVTDVINSASGSAVAD